MKYNFEKKYQILKSLYKSRMIIKKFENIDKISFKTLGKVLKILYTFQKSSSLVLYYISYKFLKLKVYTSCKILSGRKIFVLPLDGDGQSLYLAGAPVSWHELKTSLFLIKKLSKEDIFYDIGANYGYYSILAQEIIDDGEIHVFEPNENIFPLLKTNLNLKKHRNTFLNKIAVSDKESEVKFYDRITDFHSGGSSIVKEAPSKNEKHIVYKVKTTTLDSYIRTHKPPTIIKMDIEGAEALAIKGAIKCLKKYRPKIIMEVCSDENHIEAVKILLSLGYKMFYIEKNGNYRIVKNSFLKNFLEGKIKLEDNFLFL